MTFIRHVFSWLGALAVVAVLSLVPAGAAPQAASLITVPAVQHFTPASGSFKFTGKTIVVQPGNAELAQVANTFASDLQAQTGSRPRVIEGTAAKSGEILLTLGDQKKGEESYALTIAHSLTITGTTPHGAFNGTRTVLQLLHQDTTIPAGKVLDWPGYEVRSVLIDNSKPYSNDWWENYIREISYVKINDINLYLDAAGLDMDATQHKKLDELAKKYYVELVPQLNIPSHMATLLPSHPEYQLVNQDGTLDEDVLDLTNPEAVNWALNLVRTHINDFSSDEWHMGSDEYPGWPGTSANHPQLDKYAKEKFGSDATFYDLYADFQNQVNDIVQDNGKTMRVWNDMVRHTNVVKLDPAITVEYWVHHPELPGQMDAPELASQGNPMINAHIDHLYYDQGKHNLDPRDVYENFEVTVFKGNPDKEVPRENVRGARLPAWVGWNGSTAESDAEILASLEPGIYAFAQKVWDSPKPVGTWNEYRTWVHAVGSAPNLNPASSNSIQPNPAVALSNDGTVLYAARDAEGNMWAGKQSAPAKNHFNRVKVASGVKGAPVIAALSDGRLQIAARTSSDRLLIATQKEVNSTAFEAKELNVRSDSDPALVPGTAIVRDGEKLLAVDTASGKSTTIAAEVTGTPAAVVVDGTLNIAARSAKGGFIYGHLNDGKWTVATHSTTLTTGPLLHVGQGNKAVLTAIDSHGNLVGADIDASGVALTTIAENVTGTPASMSGTNQVVNTVARRKNGELVHAWRFDDGWHSEIASKDAFGDPSIAPNNENDPMIFVPLGNEKLQVIQRWENKYYEHTLFEATVGRVAVTLDANTHVTAFVATRYGDLRMATKLGRINEWDEQFAIGTYAFPDDPYAPSQFTKVRLRDDFSSDTSAHYTVTTPDSKMPVAQPQIGNKEFRVTSDKRFGTLAIANTPLAGEGDQMVMTTVKEWAHVKEGENTLVLGFVKNQDNAITAWIHKPGGRVGFDIMQDGKSRSVGSVPFEVAEGDQVAVVLSGQWLTLYVQRDGVWHRIHSDAPGGLDDWHDPDVRSQYHYAVGFKSEGGTMAVSDITAATRK